MRQRLVTGLMAAALGLVAPAALAPAALAAAPVPAKLAIAVRPSPVLGHEVVTIVGHLTPVRAGRAVTLQRAVGSSWKTIGTAHTNAASNYTLRTRVVLSGKEVVRAVVVAADGTQVLSPSLSVSPVVATIGVDGLSWVLAGGTVHTSGTFLPRRPGRAVALQRKAGSRWVTLATARLDAHSQYRMNAQLAVPVGSATLRVLAASFDGAVPAASAQHVVTVVGPAPALLGPLDAVYVGLKPGSSQGSYTQAAGSPALVFTDDGRVTSAVPADGPDAGLAPLPASVQTGVYAAHDGLVDIAWETDGTTVTLRPNAAGQLVWRGLTYGIVDPMQNGHLSGTYKRLSGGSGATITFTGAGRFQDDGITGDTNLVSDDNPSGAGSYNLRGNTVYLVYDSGPFESLAVYALPQFLGGKAQLVLGGETFRLVS